MKLIIITGMPGAGKSEVARILNVEFEIPIIVMGDVIRSEVTRRGLPATPENTRTIMLEIRKEGGMGAVASRCIPYLNELNSSIVVIEGCRSLSEIDIFRGFSNNVLVIAVHSSPSTRFSRLQVRGRSDAPPDYASFRERDFREISVGIGGVIALADIMIVNEGTLTEFQTKIRQVVMEIV